MISVHKILKSVLVILTRCRQPISRFTHCKYHYDMLGYETDNPFPSNWLWLFVVLYWKKIKETDSFVVFLIMCKTMMLFLGTFYLDFFLHSWRDFWIVCWNLLVKDHHLRYVSDNKTVILKISFQEKFIRILNQ